MEEKDVLMEDSTSIFEEIENQLETLLVEKRQKIQEELESRIELERKEAGEKISRLEKELTEERESLHGYKMTVSEYENDKKKIKEEIKEHLARAMEYQPQIETLTARTLDELKKVLELNKQLEEINAAAMSRAEEVKQKLEEKYGISPAVSQAVEKDDVLFNLDGELEKLKKIKELLGQNSNETKEIGAEQSELEPLSPSDEPDFSEETSPREEPEKAEEEDKESRGGEPEAKAGTMEPSQEKEDAGEAVQIEDAGQEPEVEAEKSPELMKSFFEEGSKPEKEALTTGTAGEPAEAGGSPEEIEILLDDLESCRRTKEGNKTIKLSYFESGGKKILDAGQIVDIVKKSLSEAEGLFDQLTRLNSPKEQFFSKQEILWHQEMLRDYIQEAIEMCEMEKASFPKILDRVFNLNVLKDFYSRLSQENWSNAENFAAFKEYAESLKADYIDRSTPQLDFLKSLMKELENV